jgi:hypothetical protein
MSVAWQLLVEEEGAVQTAAPVRKPPPGIETQQLAKLDYLGLSLSLSLSLEEFPSFL